jgi:hypothetical protein
MVMTAVVATATCCGPVAAATLRGASLVAAAVLLVTRGACDKRRLVGKDASALSTLAGARGGARSVPPCERRNRRIKLLPLENGAYRGATTYLKVEKPRFLFLEGSTGVVAAAEVAAVALPDASAARAGNSVVRAGTSTACTASSVDRPAAGASAPAPDACSSAAAAGSHHSGGARPPSLSSFSSPPEDEYSKVAGGESPCCSRSRNSSSLCSRRSRRRILRSFLRAARSYCCRARTRSGSGRRRVGPRGVQGYPQLGRVKRQNHDGASQRDKKKSGEPLTGGASGSMTND